MKRGEDRNAQNEKKKATKTENEKENETEEEKRELIDRSIGCTLKGETVLPIAGLCISVYICMSTCHCCFSSRVSTKEAERKETQYYTQRKYL